ncbi:DUF4012 domain-containing protein [Nocardioides sp.]|uniref:DUF4012 domain-containing protein n=1 Tax=Nocardioides sp. TaxID=35761 RepID=UPI0031FE54AA|nr:hypothetical protein [Nocardioides sp.]
MAVLAVVLLAVAWVGWQVWQVNRDLNNAADDAANLQAALVDGDDVAAGEALNRLRTASAAAANRTGGTTWGILTHVPKYGDDARGVQLVSDVLRDLSADGIEPLTETARDLDGLLPSNGQISIEALKRLRAPVEAGRVAFEAADERLASLNPSSYDQRLRDKYRELAHRVADARQILDTADHALAVMPSMLGDDTPRNYLLVFQNNAEIRATGGLPGAVSLVHTEKGAVKLTKQVAANTFGRTPQPVLPLTPAEMDIYGKELGTFFVDANFTPDFERTADLMRARWEQVHPERLDGVISIDPVALSYILKATGPVTVGDVALTSDNAVDQLLHQVYLRYQDPKDQDAWFREVARAVFDKVSTGAESPQDLIHALAQGSNEHRLYVHSFEPADQDSLAGTEVAGELVTDPEAPPQVGVYLNDATGAKMSYYLRYDVQVDATYCKDAVQGLTGKMRLLSDAPDDAASLPAYITGAGAYGTEPGSQLVLIRLYGPVGGALSGIQFNAKPISTETVDQDGRPVATVVASLKPHFTVDLTWRMTTGQGQTGNVAVTTTPSVVAGAASSSAASACS